jgi:2-polyprenyl-3-methyl-5-hydroxy-6-metoxy-1,4-benzoquinol methylase
MKKTRQWYDRDNFWETFENIIFNQKRLADTSVEVGNIIKLLDIRENSRILDLCCGPGRHTLEFARQGFTISGVDRTLPYLKKAKNRAQKEHLDIEFIQSDMRSFKCLDSFDVVLNLFTSSGKGLAGSGWASDLRRAKTKPKLGLDRKPLDIVQRE